jgi:hypothetical protein
VFRALSGTSAVELQPSEDDFVKYWSTAAVTGSGAEQDTDIVSTLSAYVTSPGFAFRRAQ